MGGLGFFEIAKFVGYVAPFVVLLKLIKIAIK